MNIPSSFRSVRFLVGAAVAGMLVAGVAAPAQAVAGASGGSASDTSATANHAGMTWRVINQRADGVVRVGRDDVTNAYDGDTPAGQALPLLCLLVDNSPVPAGITPDFYNGWARGWVGLTPAVAGTSLTSRAVADAWCAANFGAGWRMAEHHDGWYGNPQQQGGWYFWARGVIPSQTRFWVAIDDQLANPWN